MTWLLDLIEDHRAAVRYDLLKHGYRLEWLATPQLPWGDAYALLTEQPQQTSAVARRLFPEDFDRTRESQILELLAVFLRQSTLLMGNQSDIKIRELPETYMDLFGKPEQSEEDIIAAIAAYEAG